MFLKTFAVGKAEDGLKRIMEGDVNEESMFRIFDLYVFALSICQICTGRSASVDRYEQCIFGTGMQYLPVNGKTGLSVYSA